MNYLFEVKISDYLRIANLIVNRNEFQRKRVKAPHSIYSLLKADIIEGCIMPPVVLAYTGGSDVDEIDIFGFLQNNSNEVVILDGLQRTYTLLDLEKDAEVALPGDRVRIALDGKLRVELYAKINRVGVLYRMLTLNTGQTPMTLRHQIEALYMDLSRASLGEIRLLREIDDSGVVGPNTYLFKDAIDGFSSYIEGNELPIDRYDLLESIRSLEKLSKENVGADSDLFKEFLISYNSFVKRICTLTDGFVYDAGSAGIDGDPFAESALKIFTRAQALSGFGAGVSRLKEFAIIDSIGQLSTVADQLVLGEELDKVMYALLERLHVIRLNAKKIGNAQRVFFKFFFRVLYNKSGDSYLNIYLSIFEAYKKYQAEMV